VKKSIKNKIDLEFEEVFLKVEDWKRESATNSSKEARTLYLENLGRIKNVLGSFNEEPLRVIT
tara:strand:+ start:160 stop:348 length:189 start_codon:yes stop_codon:yes gene_type:complete